MGNGIYELFITKEILLSQRNLMISSTYSSYDFYLYFFANLFLSFPLSFIFRVVEYSLDLQNINLTAIRTVRVLRPLKAINRVPSKWWLSRLISTFLPLKTVLFGAIYIYTDNRSTSVFTHWACILSQF